MSYARQIGQEVHLSTQLNISNVEALKRLKKADIDVKLNVSIVRKNEKDYDEIIRHSGPEGSKVEMVTKHPQVCITFCEGHELVYLHRQVACSYSMQSRSVICRGKVQDVYKRQVCGSLSVTPFQSSLICTPLTG